MAENNVRVIKSQVKLHVKSNASKIPRESSTSYITLFTARSRIFLTAVMLRVALNWLPRKPTVFARLARWQLVICNNTKDNFLLQPFQNARELRKHMYNRQYSIVLSLQLIQVISEIFINMTTFFSFTFCKLHG